MFTPFRGCTAAAATPNSKPTSYPTRFEQSGKDGRLAKISDWQARPARRYASILVCRELQSKIESTITSLLHLQQINSKSRLSVAVTGRPERLDLTPLAEATTIGIPFF
jgi:hypothetical protein